MVETAVDSFNEGVQRTLHIKSDQWGIFGPTFKAKIPATDLGDGMYKITKADWDATVGPVFDRMRDNILYGNKIDSGRYRAIANGYGAMKNGQAQEFHTLMQSFSAVADPAQLDKYPDAENNSHVARLREFVDTFNNEDAVTVSFTQLQALANAARGAMEYAREGTGVPQKAKDFFKGYDDTRDNVRYTNGLINALT